MAILIKPNLDLNLSVININKKLKGRIIALNMDLGDENKYTLLSVYAPNNSAERKAFFRSIRLFVETLEYPCIIGGDFNCTFNPLLDRKRSSLYNDRKDEGTQELNEVLINGDLEDVWRRRHPSVKEYTFARGQSKSRIDFFLISKQIEAQIEKPSIVPFIYSDHNIITFNLTTDNVERGPGMWKLNTSILEQNEYIELIEQLWNV